MLSVIEPYMQRPALYAPSTAEFWDDPHISKGMLQAHLDPGLDGATRNHGFVRASVRWIAALVPPERHRNLLDLGCGPGLYAALFDAAGYRVTGIDRSQRSIHYAQASARTRGQQIAYQVGDYLALDYSAQFDVATLIYCDFGVLSTGSRIELLQRVYAALRPNGIFLFDVFTPLQYAGQGESRHWDYQEEGFWSSSPYLCLESLYRYEKEHTFLRQHLIVTQGEVACYNIWEHTFEREELITDLSRAGFRVQGWYGDIAGGALCAESKQICIVAKK